MITQVRGYNKAIVVVPSDTVDFVSPGKGSSGQSFLCEGIWVGGAGIAVVVLQDGTTVNFTCVAGSFLPIAAKRVNATNTTATLMVALFAV
jgi:hypothetical protein